MNEKNLLKRGRFWHYNLMIDGERVRGFAGRTLEEARLRLAEIRRAYEDEKIRGISNPMKEKPVLFDELAELYLSVHSRPTKKSFKRDEVSLRAILRAEREDGRPFFRGRDIRAISTLDVEEFKAARRKEIKEASVNRELALLKALFGKAIKWKKLSENPATEVRKFKEFDRIRPLTFEEAKRLLDSASPSLRPLLVFALNSGLRRGEIFSLKWKDVDLMNGQIEVRAENSKSGKKRFVEINDTIAELLVRHPGRPGTSDFIFPNQKTGARLIDIKRSFKTACRRAGLEDVRFHDLRHTFATWYLEAGGDLVSLQELLGHSSILMTRKYCHPNRALRQATLKKVSERFASLYHKITTRPLEVPVSGSRYSS